MVATTGGLVALLLWSTTVALMRSTTEAFGQLGAAAATYAVAGGMGLVRLALSGERRRRVRRMPAKYLLGCGALFAVYVFVVFMALGRAHNRQQALEVGLVNYLWPALTILFSVLLLRVRASAWLIPATLLCLWAIYLGIRPEHGSSASFWRNVSLNPSAYGLALVAATTWALYSTLARRWAHAEDGGAMDFFLAGTGILLAGTLFLSGGTSGTGGGRGFVEAAFLGAATYVSYGLWDKAMRKGNVLLVAIASYFTPLLSLVVSSFYLRITPPPSLWWGCAVLVAGSLLSWRSVRESNPTGSNETAPAP